MTTKQVVDDMTIQIVLLEVGPGFPPRAWDHDILRRVLLVHRSLVFEGDNVVDMALSPTSIGSYIGSYFAYHISDHEAWNFSAAAGFQMNVPPLGGHVVPDVALQRMDIHCPKLEREGLEYSSRAFGPKAPEPLQKYGLVAHMGWQ